MLYHPPSHKQRLVKYDDPSQVSKVIGLDYEPRYDYDPKFAAGEDDSVVVAMHGNDSYEGALALDGEVVAFQGYSWQY